MIRLEIRCQDSKPEFTGGTVSCLPCSCPREADKGMKEPGPFSQDAVHLTWALFAAGYGELCVCRKSRCLKFAAGWREDGYRSSVVTFDGFLQFFCPRCLLCSIMFAGCGYLYLHPRCLTMQRALSHLQGSVAPPACFSFLLGKQNPVVALPLGLQCWLAVLAGGAGNQLQGDQGLVPRMGIFSLGCTLESLQRILLISPQIQEKAIPQTAGL